MSELHWVWFLKKEVLEHTEIFSEAFSCSFVFLILGISFTAPSDCDHLSQARGGGGSGRESCMCSLLFVILNYVNDFKTYVNRLLSKQILFWFINLTVSQLQMNFFNDKYSFIFFLFLGGCLFLHICILLSLNLLIRINKK